MCIWGYLQRKIAVNLTWPSFHHNNGIQSGVLNICSLECPCFLFETCNYPAISAGLQTAALFAYHPPPLPLQVHCFASAFCRTDLSLYFFFFFKAFSFVCILCTLLLRGWGAGKGGTDNALWNQVQLWLHGKGWRWLLQVDVFRQGKEENSGWRLVVWKGPLQAKDISFLACIILIPDIHPFFFFFSLQFGPPFKVKAMFLLLWRLDTIPSKLCLKCILLLCSIFLSCRVLSFSLPMILLLLSLLHRMHFLLKILG